MSDDTTHRLVTDIEKTNWNTKANISDIPTKMSDLANDVNFITTAPVTSVNGKQGDIKLTANDLGIDISDTSSVVIAPHNTSPTSHSDIRELLSTLTTRLNTLANSTDTDLDQLAEIVTYIKSNRDLISEVTTKKVNVADIVNNLTTENAAKPLSAAQGVVLKALIDAITVPTKLSELSDDETHRLVTDTEKASWNAKADVSDVTDALTEAKESGDFDGISATHVWDGTTLTVTSASGTSSADLKGEKGDSGVYVGSGDMPDGYNVQVDPEGEVIAFQPLTINGVTYDTSKAVDFTDIINAMIDAKLNG